MYQFGTIACKFHLMGFIGQSQFVDHLQMAVCEFFWDNASAACAVKVLPIK